MQEVPYRVWRAQGFLTAVCAANVASLPDNMLSAGQPKMKLQEDLNAAQNSVNLLVEMLAPITISNPGDVKQVRCFFWMTGVAGPLSAALVHP